MKIHFIGIGGIGVSALVQYYLATGEQVSGSDLVSSEITEKLKKQGAKIFIGEQKAKNLNKYLGRERFESLKVIYSPAVKEDNPELKEVRKLGIKSLSYPEALGELTKKYFTIAITGTHGKSTTTAMAALVLIKAGFDPMVIVGTKLKEFGNSNFRMGKSKYLIIEACEHEESFLNYWPKIVVITNIEREHLDYYKNLKNILKAFGEFFLHLPKNGVLVVNKDDKNIKNLISNFQFPISNKFSIINFQLSKISKDVKKLKKILKVPGEHNIYNALAALNIARALKIPDKVSYQALSEYKGTWRRFELTHAKLSETKRKTTRKIIIVSDYAHHPTEVKATLKACREKFVKQKIWCVFQPHQYQRTYYLFNDFVKVFKEALDENWIDKLIITDIYDVAGREDKEIKKKVSSKGLVKKIKEGLKNSAVARNVKHISSINQTAVYLRKNLESREILIIMGAGDIYQLSEKIVFHR
ncbi:UDP-N-acetylmuramate--L-alanine ligase [Candidatus Parcubacteria bacterium]|nr:UDP-N-acetylmuramate--L-alanine ligase [Candidatus Parcubacteria bacterium]